MKYEEVKEISSRFEPFDEQCEDIRIDNTKMGDSPEIDYYEVEINVGESGKSETVVKLIIKDNGEEDEEYGGVFESWNFFELMEHDAKILKINNHFSYKELKKALRNLFTLTLKERERRNKKIIASYINDYKAEMKNA